MCHSRVSRLFLGVFTLFVGLLLEPSRDTIVSGTSAVAQSQKYRPYLRFQQLRRQQQQVVRRQPQVTQRQRGDYKSNRYDRWRNRGYAVQKPNGQRSLAQIAREEAARRAQAAASAKAEADRKAGQISQAEAARKAAAARAASAAQSAARAAAAQKAAQAEAARKAASARADAVRQPALPAAPVPPAPTPRWPGSGGAKAAGATSGGASGGAGRLTWRQRDYRTSTYRIDPSAGKSLGSKLGSYQKELYDYSKSKKGLSDALKDQLIRAFVGAVAESVWRAEVPYGNGQVLVFKRKSAAAKDYDVAFEVTDDEEFSPRASSRSASRAEPIRHVKIWSDESTLGVSATPSKVDKARATRGGYEVCMTAPADAAAFDDPVQVASGADQSSASATRGMPQLMLDTGGHTATVNALIFTPGGNCLISAGDDKTIRIWSLETGRSERTLRGEIALGTKGVVHALAISPDGRWLAAAGDMEVGERTAGGRQAIRVWNLMTGDIDTLLVGHTGIIRALAFSPDGRLLASGGADKTTIIWDFEARRLLRRLEKHTDTVIGVAFTPDGKRIVTASHDTTLQLWSSADGGAIATLDEHEGPLTAVVVSERGGTIVSASRDGAIMLWSALTGAFTRTLVELDFAPGALAVAGDGREVVVTCGERCRQQFEQRVIRLSDGGILASFYGHDGFVVAAASHPVSGIATGGGSGNEIHVWNGRNGRKSKTLAGLGRTVWATGFAGDSRRLAWSHTFERESHLVRGPLEIAFALPAENGRLEQPVALGAGAGDRGGFVQARDRAGEWSLVHGSAGDGAGARRFGGGGRGGGPGSGAGASAGPQAALLQIRRGDVTVARIAAHGIGAAHRTYSFAGRDDEVVTGGDNGRLAAHKLDGTQLRSYIGHTGTVWTGTPSPDMRLLVSGGADQTVRLWNRETGELVVSIFRGANAEWVAWTPQGSYAGSPGAGELVGWQVDRGAARASEYVRGQQLRRHLNRPDIIVRAIATASARRAIDDLAPKATDPARLLTDGRPPVVASLTGDREVTGGRGVVVAGLARNALPMQALTVFVNDHKVEARTVGLPADLRLDPALDYKALEVPLYAGENIVRLVASNRIGASDQTDQALVVKIQHNGEGALDKRGTLYVLAVGVDKYPGMPPICYGPGGSCDLKYSARDAEAFAATATARMQGSHQNVVPVVLVDGKGPASAPTKANIDATLRRIGREVKGNDTVVLFLAGHGINAGGRYFFLPGDVRAKEKLEESVNVIDWAELYGAVEELNGRHILAIDACHAAGSYYQRLGEDARVGRFIAFAAANSDQAAEEKPGLNHGVFTYTLMEGLMGAAENKSRRAVLTYELGAYVNQKVEERTNGRQSPEFFSGLGNVALVRN